ncbi:hypothetical protein COLO4_29418 [Corchorus olitorius]|uniref:Uncharacterized protein n=1 Tax=Corchorus olitorius TaxID=93759 RepID=A0A1R3HEN2_9ROSI|nr:hypothetical protein COLO4_29418 [Corchorus olitorius]
MATSFATQNQPTSQPIYQEIHQNSSQDLPQTQNLTTFEALAVPSTATATVKATKVNPPAANRIRKGSTTSSFTGSASGLGTATVQASASASPKVNASATVVATRVASSSVVDLSTKKFAQGKGKKKQPWNPPSISFSDNDGKMYGMICGGRTSPLSKSKGVNFRTGKKFVPSTNIGASSGQGTSNPQPSGPNYRPSKKRMEGLGICPKTGRFITSLGRPKPQVGKSQKRAKKPMSKILFMMGHLQ